MGKLEGQIRDAEAEVLKAEEGSDERRVAEARVATLKDLDSKGFGFTQSDLNKTAGDTRKEARQKAEQDLAEELGVSVQEAKDLLAKAREREDAEKSELDKEREAREAAVSGKTEAETAAQRAQEAANAYVVRAEAKVQAASLGVPSERLDYVVKLADLSEVAVEDGAPNLEAAKAAVQKVLEDVPELAVKADSERQIRRSPDATNRDKPTANMTGREKVAGAFTL